MKQRAKRIRAPKPGAYQRYVYSHFGRCHYCGREITWEQLKAGERMGDSLSPRQPGYRLGAGRYNHITSHKACRLKALLGIKHYKKHL